MSEISAGKAQRAGGDVNGMGLENSIPPSASFTVWRLGRAGWKLDSAGPACSPSGVIPYTVALCSRERDGNCLVLDDRPWEPHSTIPAFVY